MVLQAEKGRLHLSVDGKDDDMTQEVVFNLARHDELRGDREMPDSAVGMDGAAQAAEICRELSIPWMVLAHLQKRLMEGMPQALEPRVRGWTRDQR